MWFYQPFLRFYRVVRWLIYFYYNDSTIFLFHYAVFALTYETGLTIVRSGHACMLFSVSVLPGPSRPCSLLSVAHAPALWWHARKSAREVSNAFCFPQPRNQQQGLNLRSWAQQRGGEEGQINAIARVENDAWKKRGNFPPSGVRARGAGACAPGAPRRGCARGGGVRAGWARGVDLVSDSIGGGVWWSKW
jgi:hypothetical protein